MKKILLTFFALAFFAYRTCAQQAIGILDINNIHCNVSSTGDLFNRFGDEDLPGFEVPAGSGIRSIYAANFWLSGNVGLSPVIAAESYEVEGHDWFCGPLTNDGTAEVPLNIQLQYNQVWTANSFDVDAHIAYYQYLMNGTGPNPFPEGYTTPNWFYTWPAHGNLSLGQNYYLAPFVDFNGDNVYDPDSGDYPLFCGEKCLFFIFNDKGNFHTETGGTPLGVEVHAMVYGFNSSESEMLNNTVFLKYEIINQGAQSISDTYAGLWTDFDIGNPDDDFVGTNVLRGAIYAYNGDNNDEDNEESGVNGFGMTLGAQGLIILAGPFADGNGTDDPLPDDAYSTETNSYGPYALGYGDEIADNERLGLTNSMAYLDNGGPVNGAVTTAVGYNNYLHSRWLNGEPLHYGGSGFTGAGVNENLDVHYIFPGDSDPLYEGTDGTVVSPWSPTSPSSVPTDRRAIASMGPFSFEPGGSHTIDAAYVFARESDEANNDVLATLDNRMKEAKLFFNEFLVDCNGQNIPLAVEEPQKEEVTISVYPNPASEQIVITVDKKIRLSHYSIFDMTGKAVLTGSLTGGINTITLENISRGFYVVDIQSDTFVSRKKFAVR